ncbi:unnamed protein product, partial [Ectocarpus sp. 12 AP-2014]
QQKTKRVATTEPTVIIHKGAKTPLSNIGCTDIPRANWTDKSGGALQQTTPLPYFDCESRCRPTLQRRSQAGPARNSSVTYPTPSPLVHQVKKQRTKFAGNKATTVALRPAI